MVATKGGGNWEAHLIQGIGGFIVWLKRFIKKIDENLEEVKVDDCLVK
jgi:hypothetical protein